MGTNYCEFKLPTLTFFAHQVTENGVETSEEKVGAIRNTLTPRMPVTRSFLGLA